MSLIRLVNGGFRYPSSSRWIFRNVDLGVKAGESVRITGRNGSGKTTLLKVLCGLLPLTEGGIQMAPSAKTAYMDQFAGDMLANDLTLAEQLTMAITKASAGRFSTADVLAKFDVSLHERATDFIGHLSGGQRQIVALLSTLAAGANLLCLDEFASSMDDQSTEVAGRLIEEARIATNVALILVGHGSLVIPIDREFSPALVERDSV
jgi:ABC-type Mn2+/Zn2+ transport system ATPase subunit